MVVSIEQQAMEKKAAVTAQMKVTTRMKVQLHNHYDVYNYRKYTHNYIAKYFKATYK